MATFPITIPDAQLDRAAEAYGWGATGGARVLVLPGETRIQFLKRCIHLQTIGHVKSYEHSKASAAIVIPALDVT